MKLRSKVKLLMIRFSYIAMFLMMTNCSSIETKPITVLSYNIHHGEGTDGILDLERIAQVINAVSPDVVALQEVDVITERTKKVNQIEVLSKLTQMNFVFGKSIDLQGGQYGNAILTKFPIKSHVTHPLPGNEPRCVLAAKLDVGGGNEIVFISTHLDTSKEMRLTSLDPIEKIVAKYNDWPMIFAGDLNALPESKVLSGLEKIMENSTVGKKTSPVDIPKRQTDYIMVAPKEKWELLSAKVLDEKIASDHRLLLSVVKFK